MESEERELDLFKLLYFLKTKIVMISIIGIVVGILVVGMKAITFQPTTKEELMAELEDEKKQEKFRREQLEDISSQTNIVANTLKDQVYINGKTRVYVETPKNLSNSDNGLSELYILENLYHDTILDQAQENYIAAIKSNTVLGNVISELNLDMERTVLEDSITARMVGKNFVQIIVSIPEKMELVDKDGNVIKEALHFTDDDVEDILLSIIKNTTQYIEELDGVKEEIKIADQPYIFRTSTEDISMDEEKEQQNLKELAVAKSNAIMQMNLYKVQELYSAEDWTLMQAILNRNITAINNANNASAISQVLQLTKNELDHFQTQLEIQVEEANEVLSFSFVSAIQYLIMGVIIGVAIGVIIALGMYIADKTIKDEDEVERFLSLSVLGSIPVESGLSETVIKNKKNRKERIHQYNYRK